MLYHLPFLLFFGLDSIDKNNVALVIYAGIFTSSIAPLLWVTAVNLIGPTQTSAVMNFMPVFNALIATFWLSEQWMLYHSLGGILVLIGTSMAQRKPKMLMNIKI